MITPLHTIDPVGATRRAWARTYGLVTAAVAVGALVLVLVLRPGPGPLGAAWRDSAAPEWTILGLAVLVDALPFVAPGRRRASYRPSLAFIVALLLGWGLVPALLAQVAACACAALRQRPPLPRALADVGQRLIALAGAAVVLRLLAAGSLSRPAGVGAFVLAAVTWFLLDESLETTATAVRTGVAWWHIQTVALRRDALASFALLALAPLVVAAASVSALLIPLLVIPLVTVNELTRFIDAQRRRVEVDELSGLPNRRALYAAMREQARLRGSRPMALLLLDLDQFRRVNDALGHAVGDQLLVAVGRRLREAIGGDGIVARLSGDEFAVLAPSLVDASAGAELAQRVVDALAEPVPLEGLALEVSAAVGVALYPEHGTDHITLLRHAETAMYEASDRAAGYCVYAPESDSNALARLELLADLRRALESGPVEAGRDDQIRLHYQPQVDLGTGAPVGFEALLRWHHPVHGVVNPELIIKAAEHTAVMHLVTARVIDLAVAQLAKWRAEGLTLRASVNVSVRDLQRPELVAELAALLADRGVAPHQLQLEITEGALMADPRRVLVTLHQLDMLGVALSLDDFGTGYSSMQHLRRLPLSEVKIDKSFVLRMTTDSDDAAVVGAIIGLGRDLGLRVVAEGIENDQTRRRLVELGCEVGQGWYYARALPAEEVPAWLRSFPSPA